MLNNQESVMNVKFQDILHPEITVASCLLDGTNKWDVLWAEATLLPAVPAASSVNPSAPTEHDDVVVAVEVVEDDEVRAQKASLCNKEDTLEDSTTSKSGGGSVQNQFVDSTNSTNSTMSSNVVVARNNGSPRSDHQLDITSTFPYKYHCMDLLFGLPMVLGAVATTMAFEVSGLALYFFAFLFYWMAQSLRHCFYLSYVVFALIGYIFLCIDYLLLLIDVIITEILAGTACMLVTLSGGFAAGCLWYQYTRRVCHLFRWAWRDPFLDLEPKREIPLYRRGANIASNE